MSVLEENKLISAQDEEVQTHDKFQVSFADWTGPYDILLEIIDERELNLLDLDIASLLEGYQAYLAGLEKINIEEVGEFLVVGATLAQIKSKLLLPKEETPPEEQEVDPRAELVKYLIEYQKIKQAAQMLGERPVLGRDVFIKGNRELFEGNEPDGHGSLFQLVKGFQKVLRELNAQSPMAVEREEIAVGQRLQEVFQAVSERKEVAFDELLTEARTKAYVVVTFLSILELVRLKKIRLSQADGGRIYLRFMDGASGEDLLASEFDDSTSLSDEERMNQEVV